MAPGPSRERATTRPFASPSAQIRTRRTLLAGALLTASMVALTGCFGPSSDGGGDGGSGDFADDGCTHIVVATSSEKVNMLDALADAFKESPEHDALDECATVRPINVSSGDATRFLTAGGEVWPSDDRELWPTLWSPASTVWTERVAAAGIAGAGRRARVVHAHTGRVRDAGAPWRVRSAGPTSPISITDLEQLCSDPGGWGSVGKPVWGSFKISKTNPNTSTTGLSAILMQSYEASGKTERPHRGGRRRRRGLLAGLRGMRHPLRRHHRQGAHDAVRRDPERRRRVRATCRPWRRRDLPAQLQPGQPRLAHDSAGRDARRRRRRSSSRSTPRADRCGRTTRSRCSARSG